MRQSRIFVGQRGNIDFSWIFIVKENRYSETLNPLIKLHTILTYN